MLSVVVMGDQIGDRFLVRHPQSATLGMHSLGSMNEKWIGLDVAISLETVLQAVVLGCRMKSYSVRMRVKESGRKADLYS